MKTDYHCHILPGLDDGAQSREEAVSKSREARYSGDAAFYGTDLHSGDYICCLNSYFVG